MEATMVPTDVTLRSVVLWNDQVFNKIRGTTNGGVLHDSHN